MVLIFYRKKTLLIPISLCLYCHVHPLCLPSINPYIYKILSLQTVHTVPVLLFKPPAKLSLQSSPCSLIRPLTICNIIHPCSLLSNYSFTLILFSPMSVTSQIPYFLSFFNSLCLACLCVCMHIF